MAELTYQLIRRNDDGTETMIAEAEGSPFWSEIYQLAKTFYGEGSIYSTFGARGRAHSPQVPTAELAVLIEEDKARFAENVAHLRIVLDEHVDGYMQVAASGRLNYLFREGTYEVDSDEALRMASRALAALEILGVLNHGYEREEALRRVWQVYLDYQLAKGKRDGEAIEVAWDAHRQLSNGIWNAPTANPLLVRD